MGKKRKRVTRKIFNHVLKTGKTLQTQFFSFHILISRENEQRMAVAVPKGVEKSAVLRNRLRRRGYHALHKLLRVSKKPFIGILFLKKGAKTLPYEMFEIEISKLLKNSKIL